MKAIDKKLWRDLWQLRGQAFAITLVLACGVATYVMFLSTLDSLNQTRSTFYRDYRFADVFVSLVRAPESVRQRITEIPGVADVVTRVGGSVTVDLPDFPEPVSGFIISVPDQGEIHLNDMYLREGRKIDSGNNDEIVISEGFAKAHGLHPGDRLSVIIKGIRKELRIVGTGMSPEYLSLVPPGSFFPDPKRQIFIWMARTPLGHAFDMHGAFNSVALRLDAGVKVQDVITHLDDLLKPYGGGGAISREDQPSYKYLSHEIDQFDNLSNVFPGIFLGVAAFLLNVVITRLVATQREQIAVLKAFGYSNTDVTLHYIQLVLVIVTIGTGLGIVLGLWLGNMLAEIYVAYFRLPYLQFVLQPVVIIKAVFVSIAAAMIGAIFAVHRAAQLRPAEAMRPEAPAVYRQSILEYTWLKSRFSSPTRMILRHMERHLIKSALSIIGIALACGVVMSGRFTEDSVSYIMDVQFKFSQRQDLLLSFIEPTEYRSLYDLLNMPGVEHGEVFRSVPVRLHHGHLNFRTAITGLEPGGHIIQFLNADLKPFRLPASGIVLSDYFVNILDVKPGDWITVEILDGKGTRRQVQVVALGRQYLGLTGYMAIQSLNRLLREPHAINGALLSVDEREMPDILKRLKKIPRIAASSVRQQEIKNYRKTMDQTMLFYTTIASIFAVVIAVGIVYNSARIMLIERGRELASLRVLGLKRSEISYILLGELAILTLLAIPLGFLFGYGLCGYIASTLQNEIFRVPLVLEPDTYAFAALVVLVAATASAFMVHRQLDKLDLIAVLKTKE
ncbi:ABC transporter permease [Sulfuriflexus mobilis]|uniref:ABC transporter permease n=1 Tax=Sulfuriflexus mobilis TaxID=1811807 RepID=UPI000F848C93|nr:ABC transporter permease [Sulfuriflexus mobilis]